MAKKDLFDNFLEKSFSEEERTPMRIVRPADRSRASSYEDRRLAAGEESRDAEAAGAGERASGFPANVTDPPGAGGAVDEPRRVGRPRREGRGEVCNMNFLIEKEVKRDLERLKFDLHRSSVTDLMMEAIRDLLIKYGAVMSRGSE